MPAITSHIKALVGTRGYINFDNEARVTIPQVTASQVQVSVAL